MADLMSQHAGKFCFAVKKSKKAPCYIYISSRYGKSIFSVIVKDGKMVAYVTSPAYLDQILSYLIDIQLKSSVMIVSELPDYLSMGVSPYFHFLFLADNIELSFQGNRMYHAAFN